MEHAGTCLRERDRADGLLTEAEIRTQTLLRDGTDMARVNTDNHLALLNLSLADMSSSMTVTFQARARLLPSYLAVQMIGIDVERFLSNFCLYI